LAFIKVLLFACFKFIHLLQPEQTALLFDAEAFHNERLHMFILNKKLRIEKPLQLSYASLDGAIYFG
jgi:hypothetical protein